MKIYKTILSAAVFCIYLFAHGFCGLSFEARENHAFNDSATIEENDLFQAVSPVCDPTPDVLVGEFTAYNPSVDQTDDSPLIMASGKIVYEGAVACPSTYKFGTKIEIEGMGIYTCEDRMAARFRDGGYFDIFMFDRDEAIRFGRRSLQYEVM